MTKADELRRAEEDAWFAAEWRRAGFPPRSVRWMELAKVIEMEEELRRDRSPEWILIAGIVFTVLLALVVTQ